MPKRSLERWRRLLLYASLLIAPPAFAQQGATGGVTLRAEFRLAYELARNGLPQLGPDREALRGYVLYPYLEAARHSRDVARAGGEWAPADDAVRAFLDRHDGQPVAFNLRVAWLQSLARRERWQAFLDHYREDAADTALRCQYVLARVARNELGGLAPLILDEWLTPFQLPLECEPMFQWARDQGLIDEPATEARVRLLLENGQAAFARTIARRLPEARARPLFAWADLIERPLGALEAYIDAPSSEIDAVMLLDGFSRLARDNPDAALGLHDLLVAGLDRDAASPFTLALALGLAWDRRPEALEYFARAAELDDYALQWQARAALLGGDWDTARRSIAEMSDALRSTSQWRYWAARATEDRGEREEIYATILPDDNYFAAAAAAGVRDRAEPNPEPLRPDSAAIADLAANQAILRSTELWQVGLSVAAMREWRHGSASLDAHERAQSIHLAMTLGWYDLAVATATELGVFNDYALLYPMPYADEVAAAAEEFDLEPALIYAVMRQESLFRVDAESSAGARGLMQLRAGTAQGAAARLGSAGPGNPDLLDPRTNIRLGAAELARLLERYDGGIAPALAAYNAGPAAADRWLPAEPVAGDVWLENVPFNETREYVRRVLWHSVVFDWLDGGRGTDAREWLEEVAAR